MVGLFGAVSMNHAGPISLISNVYDWGFKQLNGYREISVKHYPKTVAYLDGLRAKYPESFEGVEFLMSYHASYGPAAAVMRTIFISDKFIKKIEAEDAETLASMEFILLHEAGHVRHCDAMQTYVMIAILTAVTYKISKAIANENPGKVLTKEQEVGCGMLFTTIPLVLFSRWYKESRADDYACDHCDNPQAFKDSVTFFEKFGTLGYFADFAHPTVASRIEKIKDAFKKKFGHVMPE